MAGHRPFGSLRESISPERRERNKRKTEAMVDALALFELRQARARSQESMGERLGVGQPAIAKMERRGDLRISSLRRYVEALGGTLEIRARFSDAVIPLDVAGDGA